MLGAVRVLSDGVVVDAGGAKQRGVLALLAIESPRGVPLESIIDGLWGEDPPASARNAVQVYMSGLRKAFGEADAHIERTGNSYRLVGAALDIDLATFTERVAEGRSALRAGSFERAADLLGKALAMISGDAFGGLERLPLHAACRESVQNTQHTARTELVDALLRTGRLPEAAAAAREAVQARPLDEHAWTLLATAQYHAGAQADSLATLRRLRSLLARELGVDPSPEVVGVEAAIFAQTLAAPWPEEVPDAAPTAPVLPALPDGIVGRDDVVERVAALLEPGRIVTIVGFGGMGKTTVALAVAHRMADELPVVHFSELHTETTAVTALERVCRDLGLDPGDDPVASLAGAPEGALLVLDNAEQVEGLGAALATVLDVVRLRLLVTSRVPLRTREEHVVRLEPLSTRGTDGRLSPAAELFLRRAEQVRTGAGRESAAAEQVCSILDGIPLAIELVAARTRALTVDQLLRRLRDGVIGAGRTADLPERQRSQAVVIESSLQALDPSACVLVDQLGSAGGWVTIDLLEAVFAEACPAADGDAFVDALEDVADLGLAQLDGNGRIRLRPPVLDEVVATAGSAIRSDADDRFGRHLERLVVTSAPLLRGPKATEVLGALIADGDTIVAALRTAVRRADTTRAAALVLALERFWMLTGRLVEGRRWIEKVRELPHGTSDLLRLDLLLGTYSNYLGDASQMPMLDAAIRRAELLDLPVDRLLVNAACCLAATTARIGDHAAAEEQATTAARLAESSGDDTLISLARDLGGFVAAYRGDHAAALAAVLAGIADARRAGDPYDLVALLGNASESLVELGRAQEAVDLADEAFALTRDLEVGPVVAGVLTLRGLALVCAQRTAEARGCLLEALRISRDRFPDPLTVAGIVTILAVAAAVEHDDPEAARLWGAGDAILADNGSDSSSYSGFLSTQLAALRARVGDSRTDTLRAAGAVAPDDLIDRMLGGTDGLSGP